MRVRDKATKEFQPDRTKTYTNYRYASDYYGKMRAAGWDVEWDAPGIPDHSARSPNRESLRT